MTKETAAKKFEITYPRLYSSKVVVLMFELSNHYS